jgi:hypothetical protein
MAAKLHRWTAMLLSGALAFASPAGAQDTPVTELTPQTVEGVPEGKVSVVEGTTGPAGDKFNVPALSFFQPASVTIVADRQGDDVRLKMGKFNWDEDFMGGSTRANGYHIDRFRTQGDLLITVSADKEETPYRLIVWTGDEQPPTSEEVLVAPSEAGGGMMRWLLIGLAVAVAAAAAFYFLRKRGRAAA